jgi:hypothetical protein
MPLHGRIRSHVIQYLLYINKFPLSDDCHSAQIVACFVGFIRQGIAQIHYRHGFPYSLTLRRQPQPVTSYPVAMKKAIQFFQSIFKQNSPVAQPVVNTEYIYQPKADFELVRFSVWLHFRSRQRNGRFLLDYNPRYEKIVDALRMEGWMVQLQAVMNGQLSYAIFPSRSAVLA